MPQTKEDLHSKLEMAMEEHKKRRDTVARLEGDIQNLTGQLTQARLLLSAQGGMVQTFQQLIAEEEAKTESARESKKIVTFPKGAPPKGDGPK